MGTGEFGEPLPQAVTDADRIPENRTVDVEVAQGESRTMTGHPIARASQSTVLDSPVTARDARSEAYTSGSVSISTRSAPTSRG